MKRLIRLYPARWRRLYGHEMEAILDEVAPSVSVWIDLVRGAIDAHLHPKLWAEQRRQVMTQGPYAQELSHLTRRFSEMVNQGNSLVRTLQTLSQEATTAQLSSVMKAVQKDVEEGATLSRSMAQHPEVFDEEYVREVRSGEVNADLDVALERLANRKPV